MTKKIILYNIKTHNDLYKKYERMHGEIYNNVEQARLRKALAGAIAKITTSSERKKALDFGCGAGNLTEHILELGMDVYAGDVSNNFLKLITEKFGVKHKGRIHTILLDGNDLHNIKDDEFDFVASYSVLHHVPDYLKIVEEFCRVLKPGGILYIDHENSPKIWEKDGKFMEYSKKCRAEINKKTKWIRFSHFFIPQYWYYFLKSLVNDRFRIEGDIHVFPDDHIEWNKIESILKNNSMEVLQEEDYLIYRRHCPKSLYSEYKDNCCDTRIMVAKK